MTKRSTRCEATIRHVARWAAKGGHQHKQRIGMKKTFAILSVIAVVSPSFAFAQANPNQGPTTGTGSNKEQKERSQAGNAANPGPREYPGTGGYIVIPNNGRVKPGSAR